MFGAKIAPTAKIYNSVNVFWPGNLSLGADSTIGPCVDVYNLTTVAIEDNVVVSQYAYLCTGTHDIASPAFTLVKSPIIIESGVWVAAKAFVGPGVRIGKNAVVGAAAVVVRDVKESSIVAGNPAREIGVREFCDDQPNSDESKSAVELDRNGLKRSRDVE
jgi:putative colanic acid biosynthesis acetyltransferase WcaF